MKIEYIQIIIKGIKFYFGISVFMSKNSPRTSVLKVGTQIKDFVITDHIGSGGYSEVYEVSNTKHEVYAMKMEQYHPQGSGLNHEIKVLHFLPKLGCFPETIRGGYYEGDKQYMIMKMYGPSLFDVYRSHKMHFDETAAFHVGLQMLTILEKLHSLGVMHWDIKPSNFVLNMDEEYPLVLIDFGCSTKIRPDGLQWDTIIGTTRYASVNNHKLKRIGLADEMICWFFSVLEFVSSKPLPWSLMKSRESILKCKESYKFRNYLRDSYNFVKMYEYLKNLKSNEIPCYEYLRILMIEEMKRRDISTEFNWLEFVEKETLFVYRIKKMDPSKINFRTSDESLQSKDTVSKSSESDHCS